MYMDDDAEREKYYTIKDKYFSITDFTPANVKAALSELLEDNENFTNIKEKENILIEIKNIMERTEQQTDELNKIFQEYIGKLKEKSNGFTKSFVNTKKRNVVVTPTPYNKNGGKRTRKSVKRKIKKSKRKQSVKISKRITNKKRHKR